MKPVCFLGDSLQRLRDFPDDARHDAGYQLDKLQRGAQPEDFKAMPSIGQGVEELRLRDESGSYRAIYTTRFADAVYVLHAFQKKTPATAKDPGQNYLVNTEGVPECLLAGRDSRAIAGLLPRIATPRQPLRNSRM